MESVLRQLTYSAVCFVAFLLEHDRPPPNQQQSNGNATHAQPTLADLVLSDASVLEPLMMFCTHALRMRDTRCCTTICKVFSTIVPLFTSDAAPAPQVREFICTEVLKACITSLNEPYFVDMQRDLASVIAQVLSLYSPLTSTPREVLCSLPDMDNAARVDADLRKVSMVSSARQQRALVLEMLRNVRGQSIYEAGRIERSVQKPKVPQQYMEVEQSSRVEAGKEVGLEDVGGLFGDS